MGELSELTAIAALLPYCHAMFLDREMAGYLREAPLNQQAQRFETQIFASNTRDEFLAYLDAVEARAGETHLMLIRAAYGEDWLEPFMEVVTQGRRSRERDQRAGT